MTERDDILDELLDWVAIIDAARDRVAVVLLSSDVHREAADEIRRLRDKYDAAMALMLDLLPPDKCRLDHDGNCQSHNTFRLERGDRCPYDDARRLCAAWDPTSVEVDDVI